MFYIASFLFPFLEFFFTGHGVPNWYEAAVWGNVVAIIPCGVLAALWARSKREVTHALLKEQHAKEEQHRAEIALEQTETAKRHEDLLEEGIDHSHKNTDVIVDRLDVSTPGGITDIVLALQDIHDHIDASSRTPLPSGLSPDAPSDSPDDESHPS